jgi:hypothetical protein
MSETGPALTRFAFASGTLRGTHLTLYPTCLVHRSDTYLETLPLAAMTAVSVAFRRDATKLRWGVILILLALLLLAITGPLDRFATDAATDMAKSDQGVGKALLGFFRFLMALSSLLPVAALASLIGGAALCALGWLGSTALLVSLPGAERMYPVRGRNTLLLDFAEALSERLMLLKR